MSFSSTSLVFRLIMDRSKDSVVSTFSFFACCLKELAARMISVRTCVSLNWSDLNKPCKPACIFSRTASSFSIWSIGAPFAFNLCTVPNCLLMLVCCRSMRFCKPNMSERISLDLSNDWPILSPILAAPPCLTSNSAGSTLKKSYFKQSKADGLSVLSLLLLSSCSPLFAVFFSNQYGRPFKSSAANFQPASPPASKRAVFDRPSCPLFCVLHKSKS